MGGWLEKPQDRISDGVAGEDLPLTGCWAADRQLNRGQMWLQLQVWGLPANNLISLVFLDPSGCSSLYLLSG